MTLRTDLSGFRVSSDSPQKHRRPTRLVVIAAIGVVGMATVGLALKGSGLRHRIETLLGMHQRPPVVPAAPIERVPTILSLTPADHTTGIDPAAPIVIKLDITNAPIDPKTISDDAIGLFRFDNRERVPATVTLAGDTLRLTPKHPLEANRNYRLHILPGIADTKGAPLMQKTLAFFTSSQPIAGVAF